MICGLKIFDNSYKIKNITWVLIYYNMFDF